MDAQQFWQLFLETGAPEVYLLYQKELRAEGKYVFNDPGIGAAGHGLQ